MLRLNNMAELQALQARMNNSPEQPAHPAFTRKSKYNAQITEADGIKFRSKKEARYYQELKARVHLGEVLFFLRQVPIGLPGNTKYIVDFVEFLPSGKTLFVDVKGKRTPAYIRSKKQVEALYPITILEP